MKSADTKSVKARATRFSEATERAIDRAQRSYGDLHHYATGEYIRAATADEYAESRAAGFEGVIMVGGIACYVE